MNRGTISVFLIVVGGSVCVWGFQMRREYRKRSLDWPSTDGTIVSIEMVSSYGQVAKRGGASLGVTPLVSCRYIVNGAPYVARQVPPGQNFFATGTLAARSLGGYIIGRIIPLYYDPKNPNTAVFVPGTATTGTPIIVSGLVVAALGPVFFLALRRKDAS